MLVGVGWRWRGGRPASSAARRRCRAAATRAAAAPGLRAGGGAAAARPWRTAARRGRRARAGPSAPPRRCPSCARAPLAVKYEYLRQARQGCDVMIDSWDIIIHFTRFLSTKHGRRILVSEQCRTSGIYSICYRSVQFSSVHSSPLCATAEVEASQSNR